MNPIILIVDDNGVNRKLLRVILETEGYTVLDAKNGKDALAIFKTFSVDLVVTDLAMPILNGFKFCDHVRRLDHAVPIIAYTGYEDDPDNDMMTELRRHITRFVQAPAGTLLVATIKEELAAILK